VLDYPTPSLTSSRELNEDRMVSKEGEVKVEDEEGKEDFEIAQAQALTETEERL